MNQEAPSLDLTSLCPGNKNTRVSNTIITVSLIKKNHESARVTINSLQYNLVMVLKLCKKSVSIKRREMPMFRGQQISCKTTNDIV